MIREIVHIDEEKCDGCGLCVPSCAEGAIQIINGKAKLISDRLCDGLGACLGHCPQGAITIERREAEDFDEQAVEDHLQPHEPHTAEAPAVGCPSTSLPVAEQATQSPHSGGCPGSRFTQFNQQQEPAACCPTSTEEESPTAAPSELSHFPIQLHLLPPMAPVLKNASLLLCADCVPVAYADFQKKMLRGRAVAVACPKLDDTSNYLAKLTEMIKINDLKDITVAHMEVPCCTGLVKLATEARRLSGKDIPVYDMIISVRGELLANRELPCEQTQ